MSESQRFEGSTVQSDGMTVVKRFEENEFPVPAIAFEIQSDRSETVRITLVDEVPEGVAVDDLGFHPEYGSEYWTIEQERITFEREIEAGCEYTTVYGIRATGTDDVEQFLGEPTIEAVDPPLEGADVVDEDSTDIVRELISGDSDDVPGLDGAEVDGEATERDDVDTLDLSDPNDPVSGDGPVGTGGDGPGTAVGDPARVAGAGSLAGALAAEIQDGNVDEDHLAVLRDALGVADPPGSTEARLERLQTDVADLLAYTDALEEFLDENGTGEAMVEGFREDVESFEAELAEIRLIAEDREETVSALEESVDGIESTVEEVRSDVEAALSDVRSVEEEVETVGGEVEAVGEEVDAVNDELADVSREIDDLDERVGDIDLTEIESQLSEIESDIGDLKEWREQLSSVMGK